MTRILIFVILCVCSLQSCIKQDTITYQAQFKSDTTSLSSFVKNNNPDAIKMNAGFWYSIDTLRDGIYPTLPDETTISYKVKLIPNPLKPSDLTEAELDTVGYSKSSTILLSSAISGLQQGLILFPMGSSGRLYLPSGLAFGASAHLDKAQDTSYISVNPNSNLLYEIKLINVKGTRLANDTAAIGNYLRTNSINKVLNDESGIRYTIDQAGSQTSPPQPLDSVVVTYTERTLSPDSLITSVSIPTTVALKDQVTAWRIMLPRYFTVGSTITMYTPSGYAYGSSTISSTGATIPANSNMAYQVTLIKIHPH